MWPLIKKDDNRIKSENASLRKRVRFEQAELEQVRRELHRVRQELDQLRTIYISTMEHATVLENELYHRLAASSSGTVKNYTKKKNQPDLDELGRVQVELAQQVEVNMGLRRELDNQTSRMKELKTLYINTVEHSTNIENELNEKYREVEQLSVTDVLTGAVNRAGFERALSQHIVRQEQKAGRLSLVMFDIDHFKDINDKNGHDVGDRILKQIVDLAAKEIRGDDIIARWGGEEFVIIVPGVTADDAVSLAERIRMSMEKFVHEKVGQVTCSFGVSEVNHGEVIKEVFKRVDSALYRSKNEGRNRVTRL